MKVQVYGELKLAMNFDCHHNARMYVQIMWDISDKDWKIGGSGSSAGVDHLHNDKENNHHKSSSNVFLNNGNSSNNNKNKKKSGGGLSNESNDDRYIQSLLISSQCGLPVYNSTRQSYDIHYSFPFEMGLFKRLNVGKADESSALYEENNEERESSGKTSVEAGWKWPRIYFEVYSVDYWDRHVLRGYGYTNLPSEPGKKKKKKIGRKKKQKC